MQINLDTSLCVNSLLPQIVAQYDKVKETFSQIDKLETAVKTVEKSVVAMETELSLAESHLGSESVFKSVLRPFLVHNHLVHLHNSYFLYKPIALCDLIAKGQPSSCCSISPVESFLQTCKHFPIRKAVDSRRRRQIALSFMYFESALYACTGIK